MYDRIKIDIDSLIDFACAAILAGCVFAIDGIIGEVKFPFPYTVSLRIKDSALLLGAFYCYFKTIGGNKT